MLGTGTRVILRVFKVGDACLFGDGLRVLLVSRELRIWKLLVEVSLKHEQRRPTNIFGNLRERQTGISLPEKVIGRQVVAFLCCPDRWVIRIDGGLDRDAVQLGLENRLGFGFASTITEGLTLKMSKHKLWYVHECDNMGTRSTLRSRMMRTGLEVGVPAAEDEGRPCDEKRLSLELRI